MTPTDNHTDTIIIPRHRSSTNMFPHLLVLIGGLLLFFDYYITKAGGTVAILAGLLAMFLRSGIELDVANKRWRDYMKLSKLRWGGWKPLGEINYVAIVRVRLSQLAFRPSEVTFRQSTDKQEVAYNVNLIIKDVPNKVQKLFTGNLEQAMAISRELSQKLNIHIYDCSTSDKKWISPDEDHHA